MERVEEIESAIECLPPEEFRRIAQWVCERDQSLWDAKLDTDSASGKLDFLFDEVEHESTRGMLQAWPARE